MWGIKRAVNWVRFRAIYPEGVFLPHNRGLPYSGYPRRTVPRDATAVELNGPSTLMGLPPNGTGSAGNSIKSPKQ